MQGIKHITAKDNATVKHISKLISSASYRKKCGEFVAEGLRVCTDCIDNGIKISLLAVTESFLDKNREIVLKFTEKAEQTVTVCDSLFSKMSDTKTPQGILVAGKIPQNTLSVIKRDGKYIALENTADPSNFGAISRTAEALGIDGIIVSSVGCDPFSPKVLRASMGTALRMPVIVANDFCGFLESSGLKIYCCVVKDGGDIRKTHFSQGSVLLIGNEANGLTDSARLLGKNITIPMSGSAESLNASAAAAIAMWELVK